MFHNIYERKTAKLILSNPFVLQCSLISRNDMFHFWLYVIITAHLQCMMKHGLRQVLLFTSQISNLY
jgi:hypothetical protein